MTDTAVLTDPTWGSSLPDTLWTRSNVGEAAPDVLSPLCWSIWGPTMEWGARRYLWRFGAIPDEDNVVHEDRHLWTVGIMYGRMLMNIDAFRGMVGRIPGITADDFERDICGSVRPDATPVPPNTDPAAVEKTISVMGSASDELEAIYPVIEKWWRDDVFAVHQGKRSATGTPLERLHVAAEQFRTIFAAHLVVRIQLQAVQAAANVAAVQAGDPSLALRAISGQADLPELAMAEDLQRLGRGEITDEEFLNLYGFHGPNEGNVYTRSWRENQDRLHHLAMNVTDRADVESPRLRHEEAVQAGKLAHEQLLAAVPDQDRSALQASLAGAAAVTRSVERGKRGYLMALDGIRAAARAVGAQLLAEGKIDEGDDIFFFTTEELEELVGGGLDEARDLVAHRRANRELYKRASVPVLQTGMAALDVDDNSPVAAGPITGVDSGGVVVEGRARIVVDPNDDVDFEDGDILVCRFTDPGWAPIFPLVEALVVDIGTSVSHGAIVAREMGMTYVIGTGDGTTQIPEGAQIRVDGTKNLVTIL